MIDPGPASLPFIDEHSWPIGVPADQAWAALLRVLRRQMGGSGHLARLLGCDPPEGTPGFSGRPGEAMPGFRVIDAVPGRRLVLHGRHRFAEYALTFVVDGGQLRARTHARFPGLLGRLYRAAVIGSGGHRIVAQRLLRSVAREAGESPR